MSSYGKKKPTMIQFDQRMLDRMDFSLRHLSLNRSEWIRQLVDQALISLEAKFGVAPIKVSDPAVLPFGIGPTPQSKNFWVQIPGHEMTQLPENVILERYVIPKVPDVRVCAMGAQEWQTPEEAGIRVTMPPPPPAYASSKVPESHSQNFWIASSSGAPERILGSKVQTMVNAGYNGPVLKEGETTWKTAADYGFLAETRATPPAPPSSVMAPNAPPSPPNFPKAPTSLEGNNGNGHGLQYGHTVEQPIATSAGSVPTLPGLV